MGKRIRLGTIHDQSRESRARAGVFVRMARDRENIAKRRQDRRRSRTLSRRRARRRSIGHDSGLSPLRARRRRRATHRGLPRTRRLRSRGCRRPHRNPVRAPHAFAERSSRLSRDVVGDMAAREPGDRSESGCSESTRRDSHRERNSEPTSNQIAKSNH